MDEPDLRALRHDPIPLYVDSLNQIRDMARAASGQSEEHAKQFEVV